MRCPKSPWRRLRNIFFQLFSIDHGIISPTVDLRNPFDDDTLDRWLKVKINRALRILLQLPRRRYTLFNANWHRQNRSARHLTLHLEKIIWFSFAYKVMQEKRKTGSTHLINCAFQAVCLQSTTTVTQNNQWQCPTETREWLTCLRTSCATLKQRAMPWTREIVWGRFTYTSGHPLWLSVLDKRGTKISSTRHDSWSMERVAKSPLISQEAQSSRGTSIGERFVK